MVFNELQAETHIVAVSIRATERPAVSALNSSNKSIEIHNKYHVFESLNVKFLSYTSTSSI